MANERAVRLSHTVLFTLVTIASIITLAISASLVAHYNNYGYPPVNTAPYRDRIRILLAAGIWSTFIGLLFTIGFQLMGDNVIFGVLTHLIGLAIAFILFIIGASSLTALTAPTDCGTAGFDRCNIVKGLVVISWIDTIFVLIALVFVSVLAIKARGNSGARRSTLLDA